MLSLEECRKHLAETECTLSDEDLLKLRNQLYGIAELALEDYFEQCTKKGAHEELLVVEK